MARITIDEIRGRLRIAAGSITYDGTPIGKLVSYGAPGARTRGNVSSRTEYASRIYGFGVSIEETGANPHSVLDKVARKLARALNDGRFEPPAGNGDR